MVEKLLRLLKEAEGYISGEELGEKLGVSRAAIWKMVAKLKEMGYEIESVTKKGYRFLSAGDLLNEIEVSEGLKTRKIGQTIVFRQEVDSTNNVAQILAEEGYPEGTVIITEKQTAGKGRRGKAWMSSIGTGIWTSILLKPAIPPSEAAKLTLIAGLSVCKAVRQETGLAAGIKWPNDVWVNGKKICGILTEMNAEMEQIHSIVVGIGINVNMVEFPSELCEIATSLRIESGHNFSRKKILQTMLLEFEKAYEIFIVRRDFEAFYQEYKKNCITIGQEVQVISNNPFYGKAVDLNEKGELIIEKENGERVIVFSGEVSIRPKK